MRVVFIAFVKIFIICCILIAFLNYLGGKVDDGIFWMLVAIIIHLIMSYSEGD